MCRNHTENIHSISIESDIHMKDVRCDLNTDNKIWQTKLIQYIHWFLLATCGTHYIYTCTESSSCLLHTPAFNSERDELFLRIGFLFLHSQHKRIENGKRHSSNSVSFGLKEIVNSHRRHAYTHTHARTQLALQIFFFCHDQIATTNTKMDSMYVVVLYVISHAHRCIYRFFNVFLTCTVWNADSVQS